MKENSRVEDFRKMEDWSKELKQKANDSSRSSSPSVRRGSSPSFYRKGILMDSQLFQQTPGCKESVNRKSILKKDFT